MSLSNLPTTLPPNWITNLTLAFDSSEVNVVETTDSTGATVKKANGVYNYDSPDATVTIQITSK